MRVRLSRHHLVLLTLHLLLALLFTAARGGMWSAPHRPPATGSRGELEGRARALSAAIRKAVAQKEFARAATLMDERLEIHRRIGDRGKMRRTRLEQASMAWLQGDRIRARDLLRPRPEDEDDSQDRAAVASYLRSLARATKKRGDLVGARAFLNGSLAICGTQCPPRSIALSLMGLGQIAYEEKEFAQAEAFYAGALTSYRSVRDKLRSAGALRRLGTVSEARGNRPLALKRYQESLKLSHASGGREEIAKGLACIARWLAEERQMTTATCLLGSVATIREHLAGRASPIGDATLDPDLQAAREALGASAFGRALAKGRTLSVRDAVALALATKASL